MIFLKKMVSKTPTINEPLTEKPEAKIVHVLEDEAEVESPEITLIPTTEFIKNIDVVYDEIAIETVSEDDFIITNISPVIEEKSVVETPQQDLLFELPLNDNKETSSETITFELTDNNVTNIEVNDAVEIVASEDKIIEKRYVLEDFSTQPTIGKASVISASEEKIEDGLNFELKTATPQAEINEIETESEEVSPLSVTISELQKRSDSRREQMKKFNYKFTDQVNQNIDEIERQPAYKRMGVDLDATSNEISKSRTSLSTDANDDAQLRSNNSFLHDNVD